MNSSAPVRALVMPSAARVAILNSCGVSAPAGVAARVLTCSPVAVSSRRARSANAAARMPSNMSKAVRRCSRACAVRRLRRGHSPLAALQRAGPGRLRHVRRAGGRVFQQYGPPHAGFAAEDPYAGLTGAWSGQEFVEHRAFPVPADQVGMLTGVHGTRLLSGSTRA
ncbi:hypothetical protein [Streptomyces pseudogriseolus]|uniref:hypothetical protein n=1 Tax=Streptomyces pseudogriseolus TaxID=36817 RepID=UPI003FA2BAEE